MYSLLYIVHSVQCTPPLPHRTMANQGEGHWSQHKQYSTVSVIGSSTNSTEAGDRNKQTQQTNMNREKVHYFLIPN